MTATLAEQLTRVKLFADLSRPELDELASCLRRRRYPKGRIIFGEGDAGSQLYLIASGQVVVGRSSADGRFLVLHTFGSGDVFGEFAVLDDGPRSADAVAQEPCDLLLLSRTDFLRFLHAHPSVAIRLLAVLTRHIRQTNVQTVDMAFHAVPARLAQALLNLAETESKALGASDARTFRITQVDLAAGIGATRETVNRWLSIFAKEGLIRSQRGQVTVIRPDGLRDHLG